MSILKEKLVLTTVEELKALIAESVKANMPTSLIPTQVEKKSDEKLVSIGEAIKTLNISRQTIHKYRRDGKIPCVKIGKRILFDSQVIAKIKKEGLKWERYPSTKHQ